MGLIGPIDAEAFDEERLRERIRKHPLVTDPEAWRKPRPFRVAVIEQCTYDGTILEAEKIVERIGHLCDYILFDEAWAGFMKFHPIYERRFAMGLRALGPNSPGIVATQSTHKQLASFSQASQIHIRDRHIKGQRRRVEHRRFNEGFMQHASTSPFYPLFASLDVGAQMMKGKSGEVLWDDTIRLGIELRKKLRQIKREFEEKERDPARRWFFDPFVPDRIEIPDVAAPGRAHNVAWESISTDQLARDPRYWMLQPGADWHGFTKLEAGLAMTDPAKLTLLTPGIRPQDRRLFRARHSRAGRCAVLAREPRRAGEERSQLAAVLADTRRRIRARRARWCPRWSPSNATTTTMRIWTMSSRSSSPNALSAIAAGGYAISAPICTRSIGRPTCLSLQKAQFTPEHLPEMAMSPREAAKQLTRNNVDYLPIDEIEGRIATTLFVVYPPGIATIVPGERLDATGAPDDRLFEGVRTRVQPVSRLRGRDPGALSRGATGRNRSASSPMWSAKTTTDHCWRDLDLVGV